MAEFVYRAVGDERTSDVRTVIARCSLRMFFQPSRNLTTSILVTPHPLSFSSSGGPSAELPRRPEISSKLKP